MSDSPLSCWYFIVGSLLLQLGETPVFTALKHWQGNDEALEVLIGAKADVNQANNVTFLLSLSIPLLSLPSGKPWGAVGSRRSNSKSEEKLRVE